MKKYLPILVLSLLLIACNQNQTKNINSDILVSVEMESNKTIFYVETEQIFECANYWIDYSTKGKGQEIKISFKDAVHPGICMDALGPAKEKIYFTLQDGTYIVEFEHNGEKTLGTLTIDTAAALLIPNPKNVKLK